MLALDLLERRPTLLIQSLEPNPILLITLPSLNFHASFPLSVTFTSVNHLLSFEITVLSLSNITITKFSNLSKLFAYIQFICFRSLFTSARKIECARYSPSHSCLVVLHGHEVRLQETTPDRARPEQCIRALTQPVRGASALLKLRDPFALAAGEGQAAHFGVPCPQCSTLAAQELSALAEADGIDCWGAG